MKRERFFNTAGVVNPEKHYFLPHRLDWQQLLNFIEKKFFLVIHAPRQSGKTTAIIEFVKYLNQEGKYKALYLSIESARLAVNDVPRATQIILNQFKDKIKVFLPGEQKALDYLVNIISKKEYHKTGVYDFLRFWAEENFKDENKKTLVIFFDEFDVLAGESLISLLTQFRTGYTDCPEYFPQSIGLVGIRDLKDYKIKTKEEKELGALYSPFNIKAESMTLPDFSENDIKTLYQQHTQETGQKFTDEACSYAFEQTKGQPWLVNALAYQACFREDSSQTITKEVLIRARESLIKRCDTHMDALLDRLQEPRVRDLIDTLISGGGEDQNFSSEDLQYVRDLGLISKNAIHIANPIYQEIIPRSLSLSKQEMINQETSWYQKEDGSLNMTKLLHSFVQFYRENSEVWFEKFDYKEAGPHLLLLAFLQRIINDGGRIHREYALGRKRVDLLITWKENCYVIEMKVKRDKEVLDQALEHTLMYMDKSHTTEGHLVIFDRNVGKTWDERIYHHEEKIQGKTVFVYGC